MTKDNGTTRRNLMRGMVAVGAAAGSSGCVGPASGVILGRYVEGINKEHFENAVEGLKTEGEGVIGNLEELEQSVESILSLNAQDYEPTRGGFPVMDGIRLASEGETQIRVEEDGDAENFYDEAPSESLDLTPEDLVDEVSNKIGLTEKQTARAPNDELIRTFSDMVPYVRVTDQWQQPELGDEVVDDFVELRDEMIELEEKFAENILELGAVYRQFRSERRSLEEADTAPRRWIRDDGFEKDRHFTASGAENYADVIRDLEDSYGEMAVEWTRQYAAVHSGRRMMEHVTEEVWELQEIFSEGEYDETGRPRDEEPNQEEWNDINWQEYCDWEDDEWDAIENFADENDVSVTELNYDVTASQGGFLAEVQYVEDDEAVDTITIDYVEGCGA